MTTAPPFEEFAKTYNENKPQILSRCLVSDLETPVSGYLKLAANKTNSFLLESVEGGETLGRFSVIGLNPDIIWRCRGAKSEIKFDASNDDATFSPQDGPPLANLKRLLSTSEIETGETLPPMAAGVFGFLGYDMVRQMERLGPRPAGGLDTPDAVFIRPTLIAIFDNIKQEISLCTPVRPQKNVSAEEAYKRGQQRIGEAVECLSAPLRLPPSDFANAADEYTVSSNTSATDFAQIVDRAKEYIRAGDIFQVVLSQRFSMDFDAPAFDLYRALRRSNPSPFLFYLQFDEFSLVGSSPEILVRVRDGEVTIRPIAGTRPRGATASEDKILEQELLSDEKERAEHLMLLDLGRNDVSRSSKFGTVTVTDSFTVERYSHVMHIVSNVVGELRKDVHPVDAVIAGYPAGTVTGAPKIRAMEIIDELENSARGPYGGAIGYFSADGNVDTCIALRTAVVKDGKMHIQAGAGIVADSEPASEQAECENKARALINAAKVVLAS